jgi:hypothetical protein
MNKTRKKRGGASGHTPKYEIDLAYKIKKKLQNLNGSVGISQYELKQHLIDIYEILGLLSIDYRFIQLDLIKQLNREKFDQLYTE